MANRPLRTFSGKTAGHFCGELALAIDNTIITTATTISPTDGLD
jgi:hypothetical protein